MKLTVGIKCIRRDLHDFYGGQRQGGISTPRDHPYIFLFTNKSGKNYGYEDGWSDDGHYYYTGEGQVGDMEFKRGNSAIRDHSVNGKKIFLFETDKKSNLILKAELVLLDYELTQTIDEAGQNRSAIRFLFAANKSDVDIKKTTPDKKPTVTERRGLVTSRVGQGRYRRDLINKFQGRCAVTGIDQEEILVASHIHPWGEASDDERLDVDNGILLSPIYDALFDRHLISFEDNGQIIISNAAYRINNLNIDPSVSIQVDQGMRFYLKKHRNKLRV